MKRNLRLQAIVLKNYRIGEIHKGVVIFTPESGIIHAIAHGGYRGKSRLSSRTNVFNILTVYLYFDPVKNTYKITDAECLAYFEGLKRDLKKVFNAYLACEIILKSYGTGDDFRQAYNLLSALLNNLDTGESGSTELGIIQFIWRYLTLLGVKPGIESCSSCNRGFDQKSDLYYSFPDGDFLCMACSGSSDVKIPSGGRAYLKYTQNLDFTRALAVGLEKNTQRELKQVVLRIIEHAVESSFNTVDVGRELL